MGIYDDPSQYFEPGQQQSTEPYNPTKEYKIRLKDDKLPFDEAAEYVKLFDKTTPQELNLTDQEVLWRKIQRILEEWYHGVVVVSPNLSLAIETVEGGYKVNTIIGGVNETLFVSDILVRQAKLLNDGSVRVYWDGIDTGKAQEVVRKWDVVAKGWNDGKMIPGKVATELTYRRFVAQDNIPIKKL